MVYTQRGGGSGRISQIEDAWVVQREGEPVPIVLEGDLQQGGMVVA